MQQTLPTEYGEAVPDPPRRQLGEPHPDRGETARRLFGRGY
jgi:hypothetical protein